VQRSIWSPAARLDGRDIDVGPRDAHRYLGPGWSFEERERTASGGEVTFARAVTPNAVVYASLPRTAVELVIRASSSPGPGPVSIGVRVEGHETAKLTLDGSVGYQDLSVRIPADPQRPAISEIGLHLTSVANEGPVFKLDRMLIR
jgi:hypothetical protein